MLCPNILIINGLGTNTCAYNVFLWSLYYQKQKNTMFTIENEGGGTDIKDQRNRLLNI